MNRTILAAGMAAVLTTVIACGGDGGGTGPGVGTFQGTYTGQATITDQSDPGNPFQSSATMVVTSAQGTTFEGVWLVSGAAGVMNGSINGSTATFNLQETSPCDGAFSGTATVSANGEQVTGVFSGTDCDGTFSISFSLSRGSGGANLTGDYQGTATVQGAGQTQIHITIIQFGTSLSGTWSSDIGGSGTAAGTVNGANVVFTLTQTQPCAGSYSGTGTIQNNGARIVGSYSGDDCGTSLTATFTVNRQ